ncbi:hypothetical protein [Pleomorphovibrio marinus]|uniref:hypothetical protein n=1 Tax=Pleomorphovibrio marinus TaxID=2164132 RepID=UPI000E0BED4B|nr:hypothetical protein [Pleomorphovibrio marinus]
MLLPEIKFHSKTSSSYYIALAAWRRGLAVTFIKNSNNFRITSSEKSLFFCNSAMISGAQGIVAHNSCKNKFLTKQLLAKNEVSVPIGKLFTERQTDEEIIAYAQTLVFPVVVKPNNESNGQDVYANIGSLSELKKVLALFRKKRINFELILEEHKKGFDNRVYVVGDRVVAAYRRTPANIIGDGTHCVNDLIKICNESRSHNPHLHSRPIIVDEEVLWRLEKDGYSLNTIIPKYKKIYLRSKANLTAGGDLEDMTESLPSQICELAVSACKAIPNLNNAGIDILFCEKENPHGSVIEINSMAQLPGHIYPTIGKSRDIASEIIDFFFPESKISSNRNGDFFFNMVQVDRILNAFEQYEYTLSPSSVNQTIKMQFFIMKSKINEQQKMKIRDEARRLNLSGFNCAEDDGERIVIRGESLDVDVFIKFLKKLLNDGSFLTTSSSYDLPITYGYYNQIN